MTADAVANNMSHCAMLVMLYGTVHLVLTRCYLVQYYQYESYAPYGTNGTHQISRVTTKV